MGSCKGKLLSRKLLLALTVTSPLSALEVTRFESKSLSANSYVFRVCLTVESSDVLIWHCIKLHFKKASVLIINDLLRLEQGLRLMNNFPMLKAA